MSFMDDHWRRLAAGDFRTVAVSRRAMRLLGARPGRVLDVGCGVGMFTLHALQRGYDCVGIDVSESQVDLARRLLLAHGQPADRISRARIEEVGERFDACVALDVIEHIADRVPFIAAIREAMRPGGRLVVSVPAIPSFYDARDAASGHYLRYDAATLRRELTEAGLAVDWIGYWNFLGWLERRVRGPARDAEGAYGFRYARTFKARALNAALRAYFIAVENRIPAPVGLSLFAVATRG